jgi:hypothetical protein
MRQAILLGIDADGTASIRLGGPDAAFTIVDADDPNDIIETIQPNSISGIPIINGINAAPGDEIVVLQQGNSFAILGSYVSAAAPGTPSSVATPQPYGGWTFYGPYGTGLAQRTGRFVSVKGLVQRTAASFTPQGASTYEYLTVPWPADTNQTGLIWSTMAAPIRWYMPAGSTTVYFLRAWDSQTVGAVTQNVSLVSCQFTYSTT